MAINTDPEARRAYKRKRYYANLERERASRRASAKKAHEANKHRLPGVERFVCTTCHTEKDAVEFYTRGKKCKACHHAYRMRRYYADIDASRARNRRWNQKAAEQNRVRSRRYYAEHTASLSASSKIYREKNREKIKERHRLYGAQHREKKKATHTAWKKAYPERYSAIQDRYRARKHQVVINDFTPAQWLALQEACDHRCAYCGKRAKGKLTKDHIIPLSKGGNHTLSNIIPACRHCNSTKCAGPVLTPVQPFFLI